MNKITLLVLVLLTCLQCYAQPTEKALDIEMLDRKVKSLNQVNSDLTYDDVKGSPYLNENFLTGQILKPDGSLYSDIPLRYNIFTDAIEFKSENGEAFEIDSPLEYALFVIDDKKFMYLAFKNGNKTDLGYFEVIASGETMLLKRYRIKFNEEQAPKPYHDPSPAEFVVQSPELFLSTDDQPAEKISNPKKTLELLIQRNPEINEWVKKSGLNLKKEEDLAKAVEYCNQ